MIAAPILRSGGRGTALLLGRLTSRTVRALESRTPPWGRNSLEQRCCSATQSLTIGTQVIKGAREPYKYDFNKKYERPTPSEGSSATTPDGAAPPPPEYSSGVSVPYLPPAIPTGLGGDVLRDSASTGIVLSQPALVVTRRIEWGTVLVGFEQANKYDIRNPSGELVGYIAEEDSLGKSLVRNVMATHRSFKATVMDPQGNIIFVVQRPFYLISSSMYIEDANGERIGEVHMRYHVWRRKYDIYFGKTQFARVDMPILSPTFELENEDGKKLAVVDKDFTGFMRELFTDGRQYIVRFDPGMFENATADAKVGPLYQPWGAQGPVPEDPTGKAVAKPLNLDQRALVLSTAIMIDFDYYSIHSGHSPGMLPFMMPVPIPGGGGASPPPDAGAPAGGPIPTAGPMSTPDDSSQPEGGASDPGTSAAQEDDSSWRWEDEPKFEEEKGFSEDDGDSHDEEGSVIGGLFRSIFGDDD